MGDVWVIIPLVVTVGGAFAVYVVARFVTRNNAVLASLTAFTLLISLILVGWLDMHSRQLESEGLLAPAWGNFEMGAVYLQADPGALLVSEIALGLGILVAIYSGRYLALDKRYETYYPLLLLMLTGLMGMVLAVDLFNLYLFCELLSITTYVLVAFRRQTDTAIEAGYKYLVMGSVGTVSMLFGISAVFRVSGSLSLPILTAMDTVWGKIGMGCLVTGLGIKSAIVPLHTWLPDAHGRAPSSVSTLLSGVVIQSALYTFLKVALGLGLTANRLGGWLMGIAIANMFVGNLMALRQIHTKRLLAFSTIAQMGYVLVAVGVGLRSHNPGAIQAGFYLLIAHAGMKGLAFLCKGIYHFSHDVTTIDQLRGMAWNMPLTAFCFAFALGGLAGIPPLAGFVGKWLILTEVLTTGDIWTYLVSFLFLVNTLIALGYYLPMLVNLFSPAHPDIKHSPRISGWMLAPVVMLTIVVLAMGFSPNGWLTLTNRVGLHIISLGRLP